jgi:hypothetical protein
MRNTLLLICLVVTVGIVGCKPMPDPNAPLPPAASNQKMLRGLPEIDYEQYKEVIEVGDRVVAELEQIRRTTGRYPATFPTELDREELRPSYGARRWHYWVHPVGQHCNISARSEDGWQSVFWSSGSTDWHVNR